MPEDVLRTRVMEGCSQPACVDRALDLVEELCAPDAHVDPQDKMCFETAVVEVMGNIVEHTPAGRRVDVTLRMDLYGDRMEASFEDTGDEVVVSLGAVAMPDELEEDGRGLAMAGSLVDELGYVREAGINRWRIVRRRAL